MAGPVHLNPTMGIFDEKLLACDQKIVFGVLSFHIGSESIRLDSAFAVIAALLALRYAARPVIQLTHQTNGFGSRYIKAVTIRWHTSCPWLSSTRLSTLWSKKNPRRHSFISFISSLNCRMFNSILIFSLNVFVAGGSVVVTTTS
ncbi:hypothetical protein Y032_0435g1419 [Ancylostoma ceylanicum]|nr:hypothetical protein Y032_0435g1419 [Ancylostoma ceylanicum]